MLEALSVGVAVSVWSAVAVSVGTAVAVSVGTAVSQFASGRPLQIRSETRPHLASDSWMATASQSPPERSATALDLYRNRTVMRRGGRLAFRMPGRSRSMACFQAPESPSSLI